MDTIRLAWAYIRAFLSSTPSWLDTRTGRVLPLIGGAEEGSSDDDDSASDDDKPKGDDEDGSDEKVTPDDNWKTKARKHEAAVKRERKKREELEENLKKLRDADKSDHERAVEKAREEARTEALGEAEKERRSDRLEVAVTRLAAKGVKVGEGDDAKSIRFADPEDALLRIERAVSRGDLDADDVFDDDGKVKTDALADELVQIASANPHLVANGEGRKANGDADTRKGEKASNDLESMTPEDHAKRKYGAKK